MRDRDRFALLEAGVIRCVLIAVMFLSAACPSVPAAYGSKVRFPVEASVAFPDFTIAYRGQRRVPSDKFPNGFLYYDFTVRPRSGGEATVSWSAGTGDIGTVEFEANGARFTLELKRSEALGPLSDNEFVITKK